MTMELRCGAGGSAGFCRWRGRLRALPPRAAGWGGRGGLSRGASSDAPPKAVLGTARSSRLASSGALPPSLAGHCSVEYSSMRLLFLVMMPRVVLSTASM